MRREWRARVVGGILLLFAAEIGVQLREFYRPEDVVCAPCLRREQTDVFWTACPISSKPWKACPRCGVEWTERDLTGSGAPAAP